MIFLLIYSMPHDDTYLQKTISNQRHQQLMSALFPHQCSVLRSVHAGEVKHGHIWLAVVVDGVIQRGQLIVSAKIRSLTGIWEQSLLVHVVICQKPFSLNIVLGMKNRGNVLLNGKLWQKHYIWKIAFIFLYINYKNIYSVHLILLKKCTCTIKCHLVWFFLIYFYIYFV